MSAINGFERIGTDGKENLYFNPEIKQYAIQSSGGLSNDLKRVDSARAAKFLKKLGFTEAELLRCNVSRLASAAQEVWKGKQYVAHLPPDKVPSEIDRAIVGEKADDAAHDYRLACGTEPTGPFLDQIESLDSSLDVLAYANEPTVEGPVARKDDPTGQKNN